MTSPVGAPAPYAPRDMRVAIFESGNSGRVIRVDAENVAAHGASLVARTYVHIGAECHVEFPLADGRGSLRAKGFVETCKHVTGVSHVLAIRFETPLDMAAILGDAMPEQTDEDAKRAERGLEVLMLDDHRADRDLLAAVLKTHHVTITPAEHTGAAIDLLRANRFDALLIDYQLEDDTGLSALARMRPEHYEGPIVFLTAETSATIHETLLGAGGEAVLVKPADGALVAATLRQVAAGGPVRPLPQLATINLLDADNADGFVADITRLRDLLRVKQVPAPLRDTCRSVAGSAGGFGMPLVGRAAERALIALDLGASMDSVPLKDLAGTLDAAISAMTSAPDTSSAA